MLGGVRPHATGCREESLQETLGLSDGASTAMTDARDHRSLRVISSLPAEPPPTAILRDEQVRCGGAVTHWARPLESDVLPRGYLASLDLYSKKV